MVDAILDRVTGALADGDRVELRGFGAFLVREARAHIGSNPRPGASVHVPDKTSIHFRTSKTMQARLNLVEIALEDEPEQLLRAS